MIAYLLLASLLLACTAFEAPAANGPVTSAPEGVRLYEEPAGVRPKTDSYGGFTDVRCKDTSRSQFSVSLIGRHLILCTPEGHAMWMKAVYGVDSTDGGKAYVDAIAHKYTDGAWPKQTLIRLRTWGFNTVGPYSGLGSHNMFPVSTYNAPPNSERLPFLRHVDLAAWCMKSKVYKTKNLYARTNPAVFTIARQFPDVFDPRWSACAESIARTGDGAFTPAISPGERYMIRDLDRRCRLLVRFRARSRHRRRGAAAPRLDSRNHGAHTTGRPHG